MYDIQLIFPLYTARLLSLQNNIVYIKCLTNDNLNYLKNMQLIMTAYNNL